MVSLNEGFETIDQQPIEQETQVFIEVQPKSISTGEGMEFVTSSGRKKTQVAPDHMIAAREERKEMP